MSSQPTPASQSTIQAPFSRQAFEHPSLRVIWEFVLELHFNSVGTWSNEEILVLKGRWEVPLLTQALPGATQPAISLYALRAVCEYFSEVRDMAQSSEAPPIWYFIAGQHANLPYLKPFIDTTFVPQPGRRLTSTDDKKIACIGLLLLHAEFVVFNVA
ncbi:hypothetical protein DXG01_008102, partial [Tephrocybe rancida]